MRGAEWELGSSASLPAEGRPEALWARGALGGSLPALVSLLPLGEVTGGIQAVHLASSACCCLHHVAPAGAPPPPAAPSRSWSSNNPSKARKRVDSWPVLQ